MAGNAKSIAVSGGFDPIHAGHIALIQNAAKHGDVIIILNSDEWLIRKKGYRFQSWADRAAILASIKGVVAVEKVDDSDGTVVEALARIKPDGFANGGDRKSDNTPEKDICEKLGIEQIYGVGGDKCASSSFIPALSNVTRTWGEYQVIAENEGWKLKTIRVNDGQSTSLQQHNNRAEHFICIGGEGIIDVDAESYLLNSGDHVHIPRLAWHRINGLSNFELIEVQTGDCTEDDIVRA